MSGKAYILVLNWKNWPYTVECLESVFQSTHPDFQVVFIDNNSDDGSVEKVLEWAEGGLEAGSSFCAHNPHNKPIPYIRCSREEAMVQGGDEKREQELYTRLPFGVRHPLVIIENEVGLGYAGGNKVGMSYVREKGDAAYIWILNNDTVVSPDALGAMVSALEAQEHAGIAGSRLLYYDRPDTIQAAGGGSITPLLGNTVHYGTGQKDGPRWDEPTRLDFVTGASMLIEAGLSAELGGFEARYFLNWEDVDLCERARRKGRTCIYCPKSVVWHREGGTVGRINPASDYYWVRNGLYFTARAYPFYLPVVMLAYVFKYTVLRVLKGQSLNTGAVLRGIWDFVRGVTGQLGAGGG